MKVRFHPEARAELQEARSWYYERSPLTATAFAHSIQNAISKILEAPTQYPLTEFRTRKVILTRFPFNIFYRHSETEIVIVCSGASETTTGLLVYAALPQKSWARSGSALPKHSEPQAVATGPITQNQRVL